MYRPSWICCYMKIGWFFNLGPHSGTKVPHKMRRGRCVMKHPSSGELKLGGWASEVPWASFLQLPPMTISSRRRLTPSIQTVPNHFVISGTQRATSWQIPHWVVIKTRIARLSLMISGSAQVFCHPTSSRNRRVYLKHCHQCKCHPFSQVLMLAIVLNWGQHFEEILVFVTLSGLVVTVQQNSQEITMNLRHYVHNALCCRSKKGSYITCDFFTTCSWELSEEGGWGPSFLIFISFVCWKQTQRQGKTQKLFTCDHRVGVTIVSILKLPCFLLRWPLT